MSVIKEKNGTYTLCYDKLDILNNKKIRTKKRGFKTQREAKEYERNMSKDTSNATFFDMFLELQETIDQEKDTYLSKVGTINKYMPYLKTVKICDLTKQYMIALRQDIAKLELSGKTKNKIMQIVKSTTNYANIYYGFQDNGRLLKGFKNTKQTFDIWTPNEYYKFEEALSPKYEDMIPFFHLLYFTGLRKGEARALQIDDFDVENKTISVNKSIRKYKNSLKAPKTPSGIRKVKLDDYTCELLKPLKSNEKWLFGDFKPISRDRVDISFKYAISVSGVKKIRVHDLRHSHASYLILNGGNLVAISKRLGHASINMTLSTYAHLFDDSENKLVDLIKCSHFVATKNEKAHK